MKNGIPLQALPSWASAALVQWSCWLLHSRAVVALWPSTRGKAGGVWIGDKWHCTWDLP